jgi:AcrR family transcriptional regulator
VSTATGSKGVPRARRERQILEVAIQVIGRRGFAHASMTEIAARSGISKPLVYGYFGSKDGLALACVRRAGEVLVPAVTAAQAEGAPGKRALDTLSAIFAALEGCPHAWSVLYDGSLPSASEASRAARCYRAELARLGAVGTAHVLIAAGDDDRLDHELFSVIWQHAVTTVVRWWHEHPEQTGADMAGRCARILAALGIPK